MSPIAHGPAAADVDPPAEAWFVYGVGPGPGRVPPCPAIVPDGRVQTLPLGPLAVLATRVSRHLFDRTDATNRTNDPEWMGSRIEAYHAVSAAAAASGPFLPMPFGTLFSSLDRLNAWLAAREDGLLAGLARVAGHSEYGLVLLADEALQAAWLEDSDPNLRQLAMAAAAASEGTAFLINRRLDRARVAARNAHINDASQRLANILLHTGLQTVPADSQSGLPAWSVLIPRTSLPASNTWADLLNQLATALTPTGLSLRLTGPWPAYAFARAALADVAGTAAELAHG